MNKAKTIALAGGALALILTTLFIGPTFISPFSVLGDELFSEIIFSIRLPRVLVALLVGAALGASGAILQGILRNPLADPYILGISSGAALLAAIGLIFGAGSALAGFTIPTLAFIGAALTSLIVGTMGYKNGRVWPERLLLAGIGLGFLFTALLLLILSLSNDSGLRRAMLWIFGDLSMADWTLLPYGAVLVAIGLAIAGRRFKGLNALMLGDDMAHSLGFNAARERLILFAAAALMTGAAVSLGGIIGFIGLLMPHIVRFTTGSDSRFVVPLSALAGGAVLCLADAIGRTILAPTEIPSGIITAIIGAPYFLYLLRRKNVVSG